MRRAHHNIIPRRAASIVIAALLAGCRPCAGDGRTESAGPKALSGVVSLHPELRRVGSGRGTLTVELFDLRKKLSRAKVVVEDVELPAHYELPQLTRDFSGDCFLSARFERADRTVLQGDAWGPIGKPHPLRPGDSTDVMLAALGPSSGAGLTTPAAGTGEAPDPDNPILAYGTVSADPRLQVEPGGVVHLRLVSLSLMRPFVFRRFEGVKLPFDYVVRARDQFYPDSLDRARAGEFYVDASFNSAETAGGQGLFDWATAITGSAWGAEGPPQPLQLGARADVVLGGYWTRELMQGRLVRDTRALSEGWIYVLPQVRGRVGAYNRLVLALVKVADSEDGRSTLVAAKLYENIDPGRPMTFHLYPEDFRIPPADTMRVHFVARVEALNPEGGVEWTFVGGRAGPDTGISPFAHTLRIAVERTPVFNYLAGLEDELARLVPSELTYR